MRNLWDHLIAILLAVACAGCGSAKKESSAKPEKTISSARQTPLPACEWCGAMHAPDSLSWQTVIAPEDEPGERLVISGTVYKPDGTTPAEGIVVYVYHTNVEGIYPKRGDETGNGRRHGYLRGWMRTNENGRYRFHTIKPGAYPSRKDPAHIHMTISGSGIPEYWIHSTWFAGDPLITERLKQERLSGLEHTGGSSNIIALHRDEKGVWRGKRDIVLPVVSK